MELTASYTAPCTMPRCTPPTFGASPTPGIPAFAGFIRASIACWFHARTAPEFGGVTAKDAWPPPAATDVTTTVPAAANVWIARCFMMVLLRVVRVVHHD